MILVPVWPLFGGRLSFDWDDFQINGPWKMAASLAGGMRIHDHDYPTPAPVLALLQEIEAQDETFRWRLPDGHVNLYAHVRFSEDCNLFRAVVLRVEEMRQPLPDLQARYRSGYSPTWPPPEPPGHPARP
jgi:hypothetical protein